MHKKRLHERFPLTARVTIQPGEDQPARFTGNVFNVSKGGMAVFSQQSFPPGKLAGMELSLAESGEPDSTLTVFGVTRWIKVGPQGNLLGIEFLADPRAGDYQRFVEFLDRRRAATIHRGGFTLIETCVAMVIICLLVTLAMPTFRRAIEQARIDVASANLKTIWSAQRVYWLEFRSYSPSLSLLQRMDLIDTTLAESTLNPKTVYVYQVSNADETGFVATALRHSGGIWTGQLSLDQTGKVDGSISGPDQQVLFPVP